MTHAAKKSISVRVSWNTITRRASRVSLFFERERGAIFSFFFPPVVNYQRVRWKMHQSPACGETIGRGSGKLCWYLMVKSCSCHRERVYRASGWWWWYTGDGERPFVARTLLKDLSLAAVWMLMWPIFMKPLLLPLVGASRSQCACLNLLLLLLVHVLQSFLCFSFSQFH